MKDLWKKKYTNHPAHKFVYDALVWYKAILPGWRIRVDTIRDVSYQYAMIEVSIWEPRKKNPSFAWDLYTDTFRKAIDFNKSVFYKL